MFAVAPEEEELYGTLLKIVDEMARWVVSIACIAVLRDPTCNSMVSAGTKMMTLRCVDLHLLLRPSDWVEDPHSPSIVVGVVVDCRRSDVSDFHCCACGSSGAYYVPDAAQLCTRRQKMELMKV